MYHTEIKFQKCVTDGNTALEKILSKYIFTHLKIWHLKSVSSNFTETIDQMKIVFI